MAARGTAIVGGVSVLVVTAGAAVSEFIRPGSTVAYKIAGIALVVLLLVGAWLLARFVRQHGDEIGEARFDTRNKDGLGD
jgi:protein-S-isoprenylcysteine O-methyltransferase Ste14